MALNPDEEPHAPDEPSRSTPSTAELPQESPTNAIPAWMIPAADTLAPSDQARIESPGAANGVEAPPLPVRPVGSLWAQQQATAEAVPAPPAETAPALAPESNFALPADPSPLETTPVVAVPAIEPLPVLDTPASEARPAPAPRRPWLPGSAPAPSAPAAPVVATPVIAPTVPAPTVTTAPIVATPAPIVPAKPDTADTPVVSPPAGALMLLPGEEVLQQLGALYLTNRRAILYAPTILRAAFLHDIDAVGTLTERSGSWMFLIGILLVGGGVAAAANGFTAPGTIWNIFDFQFSPLLVGIPLAALGIFTLVSYFFWIKRSLFLSVGGRPLIVVSVTGWTPKKLEPVDQFVNTFSAAKDRAQRKG